MRYRKRYQTAGKREKSREGRRGQCERGMNKSGEIKRKLQRIQHMVVPEVIITIFRGLCGQKNYINRKRFFSVFLTDSPVSFEISPVVSTGGSGPFKRLRIRP
jgi:hypothetical protein